MRPFIIKHLILLQVFIYFLVHELQYRYVVLFKILQTFLSKLKNGFLTPGFKCFYLPRSILILNYRDHLLCLIWFLSLFFGSFLTIFCVWILNLWLFINEFLFSKVNNRKINSLPFLSQISFTVRIYIDSFLLHYH
jgi:hypothetical protein